MIAGVVVGGGGVARYPVQRMLLHEFREPEDPTARRKRLQKKQQQQQQQLQQQQQQGGAGGGEMDAATAAVIAALTSADGGGASGGGGGGASATSPPLTLAEEEEQKAHARRVEEWQEEHGSEEERQQELFAMVYSFKQSGFAMGACTFVSPSNQSAQEEEAELRSVGLQVTNESACVFGGDDGARALARELIYILKTCRYSLFNVVLLASHFQITFGFLSPFQSVVILTYTPTPTTTPQGAPRVRHS
jgi:hypothetical protein